MLEMAAVEGKEEDADFVDTRWALLIGESAR